MMVIELKAFVDETGELRLKLPDAIRGEVKVTVEAVSAGEEEEKAGALEERPWTEEEIREMVKPEPKSGAEIVALGHTGSWEHKGITDSQAWVEEQRRKEAEERAKVRSAPMTLGDVLISGLVGAWEDQGIEDAQAWVEDVRRKEEEHRHHAWTR